MSTVSVDAWSWYSDVTLPTRPGAIHCIVVVRGSVQATFENGKTLDVPAGFGALLDGASCWTIPRWASVACATAAPGERHWTDALLPLQARTRRFMFVELLATAPDPLGLDAVRREFERRVAMQLQACSRRTVAEDVATLVRLHASRRVPLQSDRSDADLSAMARAAHYSPTHHHRLFNDVFGISPLKWHRRVMLASSACDLLKRRCSVTRASASAGYLSESAYSRAFAAEFGAPPRRWVREQWDQGPWHVP